MSDLGNQQGPRARGPIYHTGSLSPRRFTDDEVPFDNGDKCVLIVLLLVLNPRYGSY